MSARPSVQSARSCGPASLRLVDFAQRACLREFGGEPLQRPALRVDAFDERLQRGERRPHRLRVPLRLVPAKLFLRAQRLRDHPRRSPRTPPGARRPTRTRCPDRTRRPAGRTSTRRRDCRRCAVFAHLQRDLQASGLELLARRHEPVVARREHADFAPRPRRDGGRSAAFQKRRHLPRLGRKLRVDLQFFRPRAPSGSTPIAPLPIVTSGYILLCASSPWGPVSGAAPVGRTAPAGPATAPACGPASAGSCTPTCAASTGTAPGDRHRQPVREV